MSGDTDVVKYFTSLFWQCPSKEDEKRAQFINAAINAIAPFPQTFEEWVKRGTFALDIHEKLRNYRKAGMEKFPLPMTRAVLWLSIATAFAAARQDEEALPFATCLVDLYEVGTEIKKLEEAVGSAFSNISLSAERMAFALRIAANEPGKSMWHYPFVKLISHRLANCPQFLDLFKDK